jgi:hypothetical protein
MKLGVSNGCAMHQPVACEDLLPESMLAYRREPPSAPPSAYDVTFVDHRPAHRRHLAVLAALMVATGITLGVAVHMHHTDTTTAEGDGLGALECEASALDCAGVLRCAPDVACTEMTAEVARREGILP